MYGACFIQNVLRSTLSYANKTTKKCIQFLNITLFQSLFKVHLSFDLHQCTRLCLFSVRMVRVLRIVLLVNPWNHNRLRTVLEEFVFGKTLFTLFVISVKFCRLSVLTQRKIFLSPRSSVFLGRPLRRWFSQLSRFKNFDTPDWLTPNIFAIRHWFTPSWNKDI